MRLPRHHLLPCSSGRRQAIADLGLAVGQVRRVAHCQVDGVWGQAWVKALVDGNFLFRFGNVGGAYLGQR
ncbi:hypothetical protein [Hymenobacter nivis]|uniref:Uncharacterized protein n=1 Tax=Hymenobacter nivis TaxID=1850093 RepID=A0A2Z3GLU7_9BACT|nr:hypothetical protein [Hymenobacter nivis]AWM31885.1 hypothetical protein DDQ68_03220 [Hymenobacter nivis]